MTNQVLLVTVLVTNWVTVTFDSRFEGGTNFTKAIPVVTERLFVEEVTLCTNRMFFRVGAVTTNGPAQWVPTQFPPLPGVGIRPANP